MPTDPTARARAEALHYDTLWASAGDRLKAIESAIVQARADGAAEERERCYKMCVEAASRNQKEKDLNAPNRPEWYWYYKGASENLWSIGLSFAPSTARAVEQKFAAPHNTTGAKPWTPVAPNHPDHTPSAYSRGESSRVITEPHGLGQPASPAANSDIARGLTAELGHCGGAPILAPNHPGAPEPQNEVKLTRLLKLTRRTEDGQRGYMQGHEAGRRAGLAEAARFARKEIEAWTECASYAKLQNDASGEATCVARADACAMIEEELEALARGEEKEQRQGAEAVSGGANLGSTKAGSTPAPAASYKPAGTTIAPPGGDGLNPAAAGGPAGPLYRPRGEETAYEREKAVGSSRAPGPGQNAQADAPGRASLDRAALVERAKSLFQVGMHGAIWWENAAITAADFALSVAAPLQAEIERLRAIAGLPSAQENPPGPLAVGD